MGGVEIMVRNIRIFKIQWYILVLLLVSLVISIGLNMYLSLGVIKPSQEDRGAEETGVWIGGFGHDMWTTFSIKLTPNRAVFHSSDRQFNVSFKGLFWAPSASGEHTFYFKIYAERIYAGGCPVDEPPKLLGEKAVISNKSKNEYHWEILFNFTVTLDMIKRGIHLLSVDGGGAEANFAIKYE